MKYRSTNRQSPEASLLEAVLGGTAPDGGLYMPASIPRLEPSFFKCLHGFSLAEISLEVSRALLGEDVPKAALEEVVASALNFPAPLARLSENLYVLELFHGPTLAFKDFGARFMARLTACLVCDATRGLTVLAATSGDTGGAVAHAYLGMPRIRAVILYPAGSISEAQEKQCTTLGQNITALAVHGTFDDCQRLAKQAFADHDVKEKLLLSSGNSINIARLIPQMFYYFAAYAQLEEPATVAFSVPSGNFGDLTSGVLAKRMGLPVARFLAATNVNDVVPQYLRSSVFSPRSSQKTLSTAMDVGHPSNFVRMLDLYEGNLAAMREDIWGCSATDDETRRTMREVYERHGYLIDPHTAVGIAGWEAFRRGKTGSQPGVALATAHPAKFADVVEGATGVRPAMPERLAACLEKPPRATPLANSFAALKDFLLSGNY